MIDALKMPEVGANISTKTLVTNVLGIVTAKIGDDEFKKQRRLHPSALSQWEKMYLKKHRKINMRQTRL